MSKNTDDRHAGSNVGQIGTPGGGFGLSYHFANGGNPTRRAAVLSSMQGSLPVAAMRVTNCVSPAALLKHWQNPGGAYQHNGMDRHFPDIRFIWWAVPTLLIIRIPMPHPCWKNR
ncbi:hypothetical protein ACLB1R_25350 [Escherichia coli]